MMVDNNSGKSLIYTLDKILTTVNAGTGKFTNSFNDRAIIDGGLHPTQTSCVNKSSSITNGRWRNGALITQLIDVNNYILNPSTVVKQTPNDLKLKVTVYGVDIYLKEAGVTYGGLYADNAGSNTGIGVKNKAFLFESTLFWHFGTLYKLNFGLKPCYGDSEWAKARAFEIAGITPAQLATYVNDPTTALGKAKQKLDNAIATGNQIKIDQAQKDYNKEYNKLADYVKRPGTGDNLNQPTTITSPVITQDSSKIGTIGNTNLDFGRRAWIDIRP